MKKQLFFITGMLLLNFNSFGQDGIPKLLLKGSNVSLTKGTIDTETLSEIIQVKQEEVRQRVFKNLIVGHFWKNDNSKLNNFSTQFFVYNLMNDVIEGKNKKAITKNMVATASEFSEIYAFATYCALDDSCLLIKKFREKAIKDLSELNLRNDPLFTIPERLEKEIRAFDKKTKDSGGGSSANFDLLSRKRKELEQYYESVNIFNEVKIQYSTKVKSVKDIGNSMSDVLVNVKYPRLIIPYLNLLLDYSFETLLDSSKTFSKYKDNNEFKRWFDANSYSKKEGILDDNEKIRADLREKYKSFIDDRNKIKAQYSLIKKYIDSVKNNLRQDKVLPTLVASQFDELIKLITKNGKQSMPKNMEQLSKYAKITLELYPLLEPVVRNDVGNIDEITKRQFDAIKTVLGDFSELMKGHSKNDIISQLSNIVVDNFQFEIDSTTKKGVAYIDIESLVSQLFDNFDDRISSGFKMYAKPILEIGTNTFFALRKDVAPLMLASEKIGAKFMLFNTKNARIYKPGEVFKPRFWGKERAWLKPTKEPLFDDISITGYVSGLLYNIANVKTAKEFNQPFVGVGLSFRFFNGLSLSANYAKTFKPANLGTDTIPICNQEFVGLNLDIPIVEYITAVRKKRK